VYDEIAVYFKRLTTHLIHELCSHELRCSTR